MVRKRTGIGRIERWLAKAITPLISIAIAVAASATAFGAPAAATSGETIPEEGAIGASAESMPWTAADFILAWGVPPIAGKTSMTLFIDDAADGLPELHLPDDRRDGGVAGGVRLELACPEVYWVGMQLSASGSGSGVSGGSASSGIPGGDDDAPFDAVGILSEIVSVPIPSPRAVVTMMLAAPEDASVSITVTEMWIGGTLVGTTGIPHDFTGLLVIVEVVPPLGSEQLHSLTATVAPTRTWSSLTDAHAHLSELATLYSGVGTGELRTPVRTRDDRDRHEPEVDPWDRCAEVFRVGEIECDNHQSEELDRCWERWKEDAADADEYLDACLDSIALKNRIALACESMSGGSVFGGLIGLCFGNGAGASVGAVVGGCVGFVGGLWCGAAGARADCHERHAIQLRVSERRRVRCENRATTAHDRCMDELRRTLERCRRYAPWPQPSGSQS